MNHETDFLAPGAQGMLSVLSPFLKDPYVSEIMVNRPREVFIEKEGEMRRFEMKVLTPLFLRRLFTFIANESGQILNESHPLLSASLYDGSRVQLVIPPLAEHYTLAIRRQSIAQMALADYEQKDFFKHMQAHTQEKHSANDILVSLFEQQNWPKFLRQAVHARKNIVVSGGTSSGKTTFLNALLQEIPLSERIITLEDTREVQLNHPNKVALLASKGGQGKANIRTQDLLQASLRLRPERIIMGEIRGAEIMDFVSACSTGHEGSMTSIHANNPEMAFMRMVQMYKLNNVPSMRDEDIMRELQSVVDIIVQLAKTSDGRAMVGCYYKGAPAC